MRTLYACLAIALAAAARPASGQGTMRYLDNGQIKVGIDLALGGAITYLSKSGTTNNIVNSADAGREIQQSYYSGPNNFGNWSGQPWPWNPISVGDQWGNHSQVLDFSTDGTTLYNRIIPMQWGGSDPAGTPGDCTFENWVSISGNVVHVRNRLNNARTDRTWYGAYYQELPAVYTTGPLHHLWTYTGTNPFAGDPITEMPNGFMWTSWRAPEGWAAQVDDTGWGLGVFAPKVGTISGGFFPEVNATTILAGPLDSPTGYMAPNHAEILDWNIVYDFSYDLILDTLPNIRAYAYQHPFDTLPNHVFDTTRSHWTYNNASDTGWPVPGRLVVDVGRLDPMIIGPECGFRAVDCPRITIRMASHLTNPAGGWLTGQLFFELNNGALPFSEAQSIRFPVINDGQFHNYELDLSSVAAYTGFVSRFRLDPVVQGRAGDTVEVAWISCRPTTLSVAAASGKIGQSTSLTATLALAGLPVTGRSVAFAVDGTAAGSAVTGASGSAALSYTIPEVGGSGTRSITATFAGDDMYAPSTGSGVLTVSQADTSMSVLDRTGVITTVTTLRGYLYRQPGSVGLVGKSVGFGIDGTPVGSATTDATGRASLNWTIDCAPGTHSIAGEFVGDAANSPASGTGTLTATVVTTKTYVPARTGRIKQDAVLRAYLFDLVNAPLAGKSLSVRLDGTLVGARATDASGRVQLLTTVPEGAGAGSRAIRGEWAGNAGYTASAANGTLTVTQGDLNLWLYVRSGKRGTAHPLKTYVRSLPDYVIQPGKAITFRVNGTDVGTTTVDATGWAVVTWSIPAGEPTGAHTASAVFAGDAWYQAQTKSTTFNVVP